MWFAPAALFALALVAVPIVLHVLARSRPKRQPFPTLRFIHPVRLASLRRRALDDVALLVVRAAILAAAAIASAGPLLVTRGREAAWNARTDRVAVESGAQLPDAIARLRTQPPARREIVVRSALPIGSVTAADVSSVPPDIGLQFERTGALPPERTVRFGGDILLQGDRTVVSTTAPVARPTVAGRAADVIFEAGTQPAGSQAVREPWMGDAAARIARAVLLRNPFSDLQFAARDGRLLVLTAARRDNPGAAALVQSVDDALAAPPPADQEIVPIPSADLSRWTRAAGPAAPPTRDTTIVDDRRWLWLAALALLAVEWRMRRSRPAPGSAAAAPDPGATRAA